MQGTPLFHWDLLLLALPFIEIENNNFNFNSVSRVKIRDLRRKEH